jgi:ABC-type branched-subunit amino acid transport system ATPase component/predicted MFS family arabinose efflux permease
VNALAKRFSFDKVGPAGLFPLLVLFGLNCVDELDQSAFNVLSPRIRDDFGLSNSGIVTLRVGLVPVVLAVGLAMGYLADRHSRTKLAVYGAAAWGVGSVLLGLSPTIVAVLFALRAGAGFGRQVNQPTHQSLLADWYPPAARAGVYSAWRLANPVGLFIGPALAGVIAQVTDSWRIPFLVFSVPTLVFVILGLRLKEPVRGYQERKARGAADELANVEEESPSWEESWRTLNGVHTLRRVWRSLPFLIGGILGIGILLPLYYDEVFHASDTARGVLAAVNEPFTIVGLILGVPYTARLLRTKPSQVLRLFGLAATCACVGFLAIALAPNLYVAAAGSAIAAMSLAVVTPGLAAVSSLIVPPRARGFAFSVNDLWSLPGLAFVLLASRVGDAYGLRWGVIAMIPVFLVGGWIIASAGGQVASDIKAAQLTALAHSESKRARDEGRAKLLVCRGVDVRYGQVQVLFGVDFDVAQGEIVALLGTNGAGKSTLLRAICGLTDPSGGAILLEGADITHSSPQATLERGAVLMPGGKGVFPSLTVAENLRAGGWQGRGEPDELTAAIEGVLDRFPRLRERIDQPAGNLSGGEQQMLALGMAFLAKPKLLMIDELSLGLAPVIVEQLLDIVREIHAQGTSIILVEQSVNLALTVARRAVFMEKGEVRFEGPTAELLGRDDVLRSVFLEGAGRGLTAGERGDRAGVVTGGDDRPFDDRPPILEVDRVSKAFGGIRAVNEASIRVREGEIVGLIGPNGAGKTTLFDLVSGFVGIDNGRIVLAGADVTELGPDARARRRLGRSFQDAALFGSMTVREAIATAHHRLVQNRGPLAAAFAFPDQRVEEGLLAARVDELIDLVGVGAFADKFIGELSTGSRRIVDIACALAHDPVVLLLDEPSSGIAQRETEALGPLLLTIRAATGMALVVIEHDMPLITSVSDRLYALDLGAVIAEGEPATVIQNPRVVSSYLGTDDATISRSGASGVTATAVGPARTARRVPRTASTRKGNRADD